MAPPKKTVNKKSALTFANAATRLVGERPSPSSTKTATPPVGENSAGPSAGSEEEVREKQLPVPPEDNSEGMEVEASTGTTSPQEVEKNLLSLRKQYKRSASNLARVKSHLRFVRACASRGSTPKGLRINVRCHALLADLTNIREAFASTGKSAEKDLVGHLIDHYEETSTLLEAEVRGQELAMTQHLRLLPQDSDAARKHRELYTKTLDNIRQQEDKMERGKQRKLDTIQETTNQGTRRGRRRPTGASNEGTRRAAPQGTAADPPPQHDETKLIGLLTSLLEKAAKAQQPQPRPTQALGGQPPPLLPQVAQVPQQPQLQGPGFLPWGRPPYGQPHPQL